MISAPTIRTIILFAALATLAARLSPGPAQAKPGEKREMTVMSRNLYLGASLAPALDPNFPGGLVGAIPVIINEFFSTDYIARAVALAEEIAAEEPDLIGLQQVAVWTLEGEGSAPLWPSDHAGVVAVIRIH